MIRNQTFSLGVSYYFVLAKTIQSDGCAKPESAFAVLQSRIDLIAGKAFASRKLIQNSSFRLSCVNHSAKPLLIRSDPQAPVSVEERAEGFPANFDASCQLTGTHDRSHCVAGGVRDPHISV